jgi:hypothetical protein
MAAEPTRIHTDCLILLVPTERSQLPRLMTEAVEGLLHRDAHAEDGCDPPVPGYVDESGRFQVLL